jgi:hypothetical protein
MINKIKFMPHVPGETSEKSVIDYSFDPIVVNHLHMIFDFIPDDFCTSFPTFFISETLLQYFIYANITGFSNPKIISHEQNEQSPIKENSAKYYMIDIMNKEDEDLTLLNNELFISAKVKDILSLVNIKQGKFSEN